MNSKKDRDTVKMYRLEAATQLNLGPYPQRKLSSWPFLFAKLLGQRDSQYFTTGARDSMKPPPLSAVCESALTVNIARRYTAVFNKSVHVTFDYTRYFLTPVYRASPGLPSCRALS